MSRTTEASTALAPRNEGAVARRSPWDELTDLRQRMDDLFSRAFGYTPLSRLIDENLALEPGIDLYETDDKFQAYLPLPGYTPQDINLEATENAITVSGERKALYEDDKATKHRQNGVSSSSQFRLHYTFPSEIDPKRVKATFANGILQLEVPKTEQARAKSVKVSIASG